MIVNVHMKGGFNVFQFATRGDLKQAVKREADNDDRAVVAFLRSPLFPDWHRLRVTYMKKHAIDFVVAAEDVAESDADLPAKAIRDERAEKWRQRQEAEGAPA